MSENLPIVGYINPLVAEALRDPTSGINTTQLRAEPNGCVSEPLVFRSDALAKLAEKDAEIARLKLEVCHANDTADAAISKVTRLKSSLTEARSSIASGSPMKAAYTLDTALKGPEA